MNELQKRAKEYLILKGVKKTGDKFMALEVMDLLCEFALREQLNIGGVSNRLETTCAKAEPLIIEMNKDHLIELYNFAYEQAVKTGKVDELKEIDSKLNGC